MLVNPKSSMSGGVCGVTLHVDDGLVGGWKDRVNGVDTLSEKYNLTVSPPLKKVGDQLRFLKRTLEVAPQGLKVIIDPKYMEKMIGLLNLTHVRTRKVPSTREITTADDSEPLLDADASVYRAVLGCMLHVAPDRIPPGPFSSRLWEEEDNEGGVASVDPSDLGLSWVVGRFGPASPLSGGRFGGVDVRGNGSGIDSIGRSFNPGTNCVPSCPRPYFQGFPFGSLKTHILLKPWRTGTSRSAGSFQ